MKCGVKNTFNLIENKLEKVKNPANLFRTHNTHYNNIFSFVLFYSTYNNTGDIKFAGRNFFTLLQGYKITLSPYNGK